jgi:hypothetical protein
VFQSIAAVNVMLIVMGLMPFRPVVVYSDMVRLMQYVVQFWQVFVLLSVNRSAGQVVMQSEL